MFTVTTTITDQTVTLTLAGELDAAVAEQFHTAVTQSLAHAPTQLVLMVSELTFMASAGLRVIAYAKQKLGQAASIYVIGAQDAVLNTLHMSGFDQAVYLQDQFNPNVTH